MAIEPPKSRTLGTALRHLLELLDGDVAAIYKEEGLEYLPRFTPIMRALASGNPMAIRDLAAAAAHLSLGSFADCRPDEERATGRAGGRQRWT